jgi:5-methylcytosine-specific restriction endonuclease McrA
MKGNRLEVFNKYGGKCAYCGCELTKSFHVDHIEPHWHNYTEEQAAKHKIKKGADSIENMNPACPRCNKWKGTYSVDGFRREISLQIQRLNSYSPNYRLAKDYGLLSEAAKPVVFYFETLTP